MLSKKSPRTSCRIRIRNNRIGATEFLNQRCAMAPDLESILRAHMSKIVFRQHRPGADSEEVPALMLPIRFMLVQDSDDLACRLHQICQVPRRELFDRER